VGLNEAREKMGTVSTVIIITIVFVGLIIPLTSVQNAASSSAGITKLKNLGDRIDGLNFNSGVFFGNVETCSDVSTCIGTNKDDIIYGGAHEQVFALNGNDMIFGGLDGQLYGGKNDDIVLAGAGHNLLDGGPGEDTLLGGVGNDLLTGGDDNDKLFAGTGDSVLDGGKGANHFDCPVSLLGLARAIVLDYNPDNGDTIAGQCKIINTIGNTNPGSIPEINPAS
jgi:Ca2+-binding RTX toxin-like protein